MNEASKAMNFTWSTDIIKDWGMFPKSGIFNFCTISDSNKLFIQLIAFNWLGPYNLSGEWGGIFGNVVNGNYHLSVNSYMNMYERFYIVDHVGFIKSRRAMFFIPFADGEDYDFFKR